MTKKELENSFNKALEDFKADVKASFDECSKESATQGDIAELAKLTFYALNDFKNALLNYLE